MPDLEPLFLTFQMAFLTTVILFVIGIPLAYWLSTDSFRLKFIIEAIISLPLILPPSVLGFYLLLAFSPANSFGSFLQTYFDVNLVFTFEGLIIASVIYSLPFMVQPILAGFRMLPLSLVEASYSLGKNKMITLFKVLIPNIKASLITGGILAFAHTVGEFGVVLMVGGNIPHETRVVSVAIYDEVEAMNYKLANTYSVILLFFAFILLLIVYLINFRLKKIHDSN
jgi:molybdate transport system permease protein